MTLVQRKAFLPEPSRRVAGAPGLLGQACGRMRYATTPGWLERKLVDGR
jgi:hypothetical protein